MTDDIQEKASSEVVGLRSKLQSIEFGADVKQRAKGVQKRAKTTLNHELFKECFLNKEKSERSMTQFRSKDHLIVVNPSHKVELSSDDDK